MEQAVHFGDLPQGTCYRKGRARRLRKKAAPDAYITQGKRGLRKGREKADAKVRPISCPLSLLGVGLTSRPGGALVLGTPKKRPRC